MSKAFTKESDRDEDDERELPDEPGVPGGFTNYITPAGHRRLSEELQRLWQADRPKLVETIASPRTTHVRYAVPRRRA